ncbi:MAG: glutathione S-transferase family protein [Rhizobiaceae bacterium]
MILIGQYDSSFVRRVGIALKLYGIPFEHKPWSITGDVEKLQQYNPLIRVPTLVLSDGDVLIESNLILDYVDSLIPAGKRMYPQAEPERHRALHVSALATGMADKAVSLFYEKVLHKDVSQFWVDRCRSQIMTALDKLDADRTSRDTPYWFGEAIGHCDIAVACALRHATDTHPGLIPMDDFPALQAHCAKLEAMPVFQEISQPFVAPA